MAYDLELVTRLEMQEAVTAFLATANCLRLAPSLSSLLSHDIED